MATEGMTAEPAPTAADVPARPSTMQMTIQSGMLKTLGINLYTSVGKVLVEFVANAYDSDATKVEIVAPFEKIATERRLLRKRLNEALERARAQAAAAEDAGKPGDGAAENATDSAETVAASGDESGDAPAIDPAYLKFELLTQVLPPNLEVTISDDGHGMSTDEVQRKFLPLNRSRRADKGGKETRLMTESGLRYVMGRKGLGKLAGFGAAQAVKVWTKRRGDTHATVITMDDDALSHVEDLRGAKIPVEYEDGLDLDIHGTKVTFSCLKSDALQETEPTIRDAIARSFFAVKPEDFTILLNGSPVHAPVPDYEYIHPPGTTKRDIEEDRLATATAPVEGLGDVSFRYYIGFRDKKDHLTASRRGARVYCNKRLAAGPTLFGLGSGMHSFHSQDYMEAVVEVDEFDRGPVDLINTSRTQFKEGNELIRALSAKVTELMKEAIAKHAKVREANSIHEMEKNPKGKVLLDIVAHLPRRTRKAAGKLLSTIASVHAVGTTEFDELAPVILNSVNATEVLSKLISLGSKPETLGRVARELRELAEIERLDALKLYRGRRSGIQALQTLMAQAMREDWKKKMREKELHDILKENPWLIRPEYSTYLTSDRDINKTVTRIAESCKVDHFSPILTEDGKDDETRPDLVFLMSDTVLAGPYTLLVVELKSPSKPLHVDHYRQLEDYIYKVRAWCENHLDHAVAVNGYLIGTFPQKATTVPGEAQLLDRWKKSGPKDDIKIYDVMRLIDDARYTHLEAIKALEQETGDDDEGDDQAEVSPPPAPDHKASIDEAGAPDAG